MQNEFGFSKANATLIVKKSTKITTQNQKYMGIVGKNVTVFWEVISDKTLTLNISWSSDTEVGYDSRYFITPENSLVISNSKMNDSGTNTCIAQCNT